MNFIKTILSTMLVATTLISCSSSDDDKDTEYPTINMDYAEAFPQNCVILYRGESFNFKAIFSDNQELGNYNIEIHQNFDHHSHSTDATECDPEPNKSPVKPLVYNKDFSIPSGQTNFAADNQIDIPSDVDTGDYHFMVRLTDAAGWQQIKAVSLKIKDRN